jgi:hypothetical protein
MYRLLKPQILFWNILRSYIRTKTGYKWGRNFSHLNSYRECRVIYDRNQSRSRVFEYERIHIIRILVTRSLLLVIRVNPASAGSLAAINLEKSGTHGFIIAPGKFLLRSYFGCSLGTRGLPLKGEDIWGWSAHDLELTSTASFRFLSGIFSYTFLFFRPVVQLLKNFSPFYGTRKFITVFTRALHWSLPWARSIQFIHLSRIHFNIIHPPTFWSS